MKTSERALFIVLLVSLAVVSPLIAQESVLELDPANTKIQFTLDATLHTVHGTFKLKSGTIRFNPATGTASGLLVVDATSGNTENDGRDRKMHQVVLESAKFPEITFAPSKITGTWIPAGDSIMIVEGVFRLHGTDHPITASVPVHIHGNMLDAKIQFIVPYIQWGLKSPNNFFLHVAEQVEVEVVATGHLSSGAAQP